jgi:hypothetical protein
MIVIKFYLFLIHYTQGVNFIAIIMTSTFIPKRKLIGKAFAKGMVVEIVKGKKMSWVGLAHETNANQ